LYAKLGSFAAATLASPLEAVFVITRVDAAMVPASAGGVLGIGGLVCGVGFQSPDSPRTRCILRGGKVLAVRDLPGDLPGDRPSDRGGREG
jgi:hypothetical protein